MFVASGEKNLLGKAERRGAAASSGKRKSSGSAASPRSDVAASKTKSEPKRKQPTLRFYGETFIFDTVSGMFYNVSPTASFMLRGLDAGVKLEKLAADVERRYGIDHARAMHDIELLRNDLAAIEPLGLVRS